ncbi:MAG: TIGR03545 family protein [Endomicrobiia bacterium]
MNLKFLRIIRWKAVLPLTIVIILIVIFFSIYFPVMLKNGIIFAGESIFGAKVEIKKLSLNYAKLGITISQLEVANKNKPMTNLFQIGEIKFSMKPLLLLEKKVLIEEMSVKNVQLNTPRKTDGTLPPKKVKKIAKKEKKKKRDTYVDKLITSIKQKSQEEIDKIPVIKDAKTIEKEIKNININDLLTKEKESLETPKLIQSLVTDSEIKFNKIKSDIDNLKIDDQISTVKLLVEEVKKIKIETIQDIPPATQQVQELTKKSEGLVEVAKKVDLLQKEISTELAQKSDLVKQINSSIQTDYKNLLSKIKLPELPQGDIAKILFGSMWTNYVDKVLGYINLVRKYMPPKSDKKKLEIKRAKGRDIYFHKENSYPTLWIKKVELSGQLPSQLSLAGEVYNISTNQNLTKKPISVEILASQGEQRYSLTSEFERRKDVSEDTIKIEMKNLPLGSFEFGDVKYLPKFEGGNINVTSEFVLKGEELNCLLDLSIEQIKYGQKSDSTDFLTEIVYDLITGLKNVTVKAKLYGKIDSLKSELESNIDKVLSEKIKSIYGKKVDELKTELKTKLDNMINVEKEKFLKEYENKKSEVENMVKTYLAKLQEQKQDIENQIAQLKKQVEEKQKSETQQKIDSLKKDAMKLFGK